MLISSKEDIVQAVRQAGVVGAGGAGFPAYVKLEATVDTVIANGSECEPLLATDKSLMKEYAGLLIDGMKLAMQATGAKQGIIGVKGVYKDVVSKLEAVLPVDGSISLHLLGNYYPAGDEFLLVYDVTKRIIPEGGIPLNVGVVVNNVLTLMQMAQACEGKAVTERALTIIGEVENPQVITASLGTTYNDILKIAGGTTTDDFVVLDGGPMMGQIVKDLDAGIGKTTSGIIVLPADHFIVQMRDKPLAQMIKQSKAACCQCFRCTDMCPRYLLGHDLYPHKTMRTIDYNQADPAKHITSSFLCSQCGVCELVGCDVMKLSPRQVYAEYRTQLTTKGVKNPHRREITEVRSNYEDAKVSIPALVRKLYISHYVNHDIPFNGHVEVNKVRIPINKHIGAPAPVLVSLGDELKLGDVIAATPEDKLGSVYHSSLIGRVTDMGEGWIEVSK